MTLTLRTVYMTPARWASPRTTLGARTFLAFTHLKGKGEITSLSPFSHICGWRLEAPAHGFLCIRVHGEVSCGRDATARIHAPSSLHSAPDGSTCAGGRRYAFIRTAGATPTFRKGRKARQREATVHVVVAYTPPSPPLQIPSSPLTSTLSNHFII